nr:hypothetical protein [Tanacetum cinerariifolium]
MGITVYGGPIESGVKHLLGGVVRAMMSPGRSIVEENPTKKSRLRIFLSKEISEGGMISIHNAFVQDEMSADVARGHDGNGGGGRRASRLHTRQKTRNLRLKAITDKSGPVLIWFEVDDRETLMPLSDHGLIGPTTSGSSLGSCPCTTLLGAKCHRSGRRGSWQRLGLSTLHFLKLLGNKLESMKILENKLESLKLLENKLESMMILENKLESLKLQENQPVDGLMSANVVRGHGDDGGDDDRPLSYQVRAPESPILVAGKEFPLYYPSWRQMPPERKAEIVAKIGTQFELCPHMESDRWLQIYVGIQQHLQKIYNGKKAALKERYWVPKEDGTYDLERIRRGRPSYIFEVDWDAQLTFWNDPKNLARAAQNKQNRAKNKAVCRQGSQFIVALRDMHMETSATRKYLSLIHTFFLIHTVGGVFLNPDDKALNDEILRLQGLGSNTPTGVPYTKDEIIAIVRGGKQRGHILDVGRVPPGQDTLESQPEYDGGSGSGGFGDDEPGDDEDGDEDEEDS